MEQQTAVEQFADNVLSYKNPTNINGTDYILIPINKVEYLKQQAKQMEREQHGDTWDEAIKAHEKRSNVIARSICDFDDYYNETYNQNK